MMPPALCRLHSVALVCKRFCKLCSAPKLLRQLEVSIGGPNAVPRAEAVLIRLARHMPHVRSLSLDFSKPDDVVALHQLQAILMGCLSISSAAGQLGELAVRGNLLPTTGSWLLLMRSLRSLSIVSLAPVVIPSMFTLTRLESLELEGNPLKYSPVSARLPPSLTQLCIASHLQVTTVMPAQVRPHSCTELYWISALPLVHLLIRYCFVYQSAGHPTHQAAAPRTRGCLQQQQQHHKHPLDAVQPHSPGAA